MFMIRLIDHKVRSRIYCVSFLALLAAGNVWAEDDLADFDPDGNIPILGLLRKLWDFLGGLVG